MNTNQYIICNNCNKIGHISSNCTAPTTSYGIIIFKTENKISKLLLINRKDSLCYIDFIRGKYDIDNIKYIQILIDKFSNTEKENIILYDFETLWKKLWLIDRIEVRKFKKEYDKSEIKFRKLKNGYFDKILNKTINLNYFTDKSTTNYETSEWEFPKGRKMNNEKNMDCAIRECQEETNYNSTDYDIIINLVPFNELYTGENKIKYRHIYYLSALKNYQKEIELKTKEQKMEVFDMKWLTYEECLTKMRDYHKTRVKLIKDVFSLINNLEDYIII
jgi:8-oxo-dGTP pyrophosphatase MutT (NUDIX family)